MMNEKIVSLLANLLSEKGYDIRNYRGGIFSAFYTKDDFYYYIDIRCEESIKIEHNITFMSRNQDLISCYNRLKKNYKKATADINFLKEQLEMLDSKDNILKMLKMCKVPADTIEKIRKKL